MKKFLFGCTIFFLVAVAVGGVAFYKGCYLPIKSNMADMMQMAKLGAYNDRLTKKDAYIPPADHIISADQLRRFLAVQQRVRAATGASFTNVRERFESLPGRMKNAQGDYAFDFKEMMATFKGIGPDVVRIKEAQVQALNEQDFSKQEYRWVRESILRAMGQKITGYIEDASSGVFTPGGDTKPGGPTRVDEEPAVPPENVKLVKEAADSLKVWLPVAVLGF